MDDLYHDVAGKVEQGKTTATKAVAAFLSFLGTYAAVFIADVADAASWVNQALVVVGGAIGTAWTYWAKNKPKY
jgi:hypothetical protein